MSIYHKNMLSVGLLLAMMVPLEAYAAPSNTPDGQEQQAPSAKPIENMSETIEADFNDVASIEQILAALYDVVSGNTDEKRDWKRMKSLFLPEGKLIPTGQNGPRVMSVDDYSVMGDRTFAQIPFYEVENSRIVEQFGNIAHVFSTYESRHDPSESMPFMRGINSIQLVKHSGRWWIANVMWQAENKDHPLPDKYLK